jgi:hypothetical protein
MQLAASHQAPARFQVRSGCVFERPIGGTYIQSGVLGGRAISYR